MDCSSSSVLSDDDFTLDGTPYTFNQILLNTDNGGLLIGLLPALTVSAAELTLMVDGTAFAFEDADEGTNTFTWSSTGLSWTVGQSVSLSLTRTPPAETGEWSATLTTGTVSNLVGCDEELRRFLLSPLAAMRSRPISSSMQERPIRLSGSGTT